MATFFTGDLHLDHFNVTKFCPLTRPFHTKEQMNESMIDHWNSIVKPEDDIIHNGDFCFSGPKRCEAFLERLNGRKHFILGNHDFHNKKVFERHCETVTPYMTFKHNKTRIVVCHFPIHFWHSMEHGSLMAFGHMHGSYQPEGRSMDVGFDNLGRIISLEEFVSIMMERPIRSRKEECKDGGY